MTLSPPLASALDALPPGLTWATLIGLKSMALLGAAWVMSLALRRAPATIRHLLWGAALGGVLAVPVLVLVLPGWSIPVLPAAEATDALAFDAPAEGGIGAALPTSGTPGYVAWILGVWLAGLTLTLGWAMVGLYRTARLTRRATPLGGPRWNHLIAELTLELNVPTRTRWRRSDEIAAPMTWGVRRPVVVVPAASDDWSDERRRVVLLHELIHVRRGDWLVHLVGHVACAVYWFNPLAWIGVRRLHVAREQACDEEVIARGTPPSVYAEHLLDIARMMSQPRAVATLSMASPAELEGRLLTILNGATDRRTGLAAVATAITIGLATVALASMHPVPVSSDAAPLRIAAAPELGPLLAAIEANEDVHAELDRELDAIHDAKMPHYEALDALEMEIGTLHEELDAIDVLIADPEGTRPTAQTTELIAARKQLYARIVTLEAEAEAVVEILDPMIDAWNAIVDRMDGLDEELDALSDRCDEALRRALRTALDDVLAERPLGARIPAATRPEIVRTLFEESTIRLSGDDLWMRCPNGATVLAFRNALASAGEPAASDAELGAIARRLAVLRMTWPR